jgi:protein gp37
VADTSIEWTDKVWNPVRGCDLVSAGCRSCYAMRQAHRFSGKGQPYEGLTKMTSHGPVWTGKVRTVPELLDMPLRWKRPRRIFVNSMSDLFHEDVPFEFIVAVFGVMAASMQHTFQILTKRPQRMLEWFGWLAERGGLGPFIRSIRIDGDRTIPNYFTGVMRTTEIRGKTVRAMNDPWMQVFNAAAVVGAAPLPNVWLGVSVEDQATADERIPLLLQTPAAVRFLSCEPLLGPIDLRRHLEAQTHERACPKGYGIGWVIVGGESGPGARDFDIRWARDIVAQCRAAGAPVLMKQLGARPVWSDEDDSSEPPHWGRISLRDRKGGDMAEWPEDLRVREYPR